MTDPLTYDSPPDVCWTRTNMAEAAPGILTAVGWSFYGRLVDESSRRGFAQLGVLPRRATTYPTDQSQHLIGTFHGRASLNVTVLRAMMSGLPGVSGDDVERDIIGSVRPDVRDDTYGMRFPWVAVKAPITLLRSARAARAVLEETRSWWSRRFDPTGIADSTPPQQALAEAANHFRAAIVAQSRNRLLYQGSTSTLADLATRAGHPDHTSRLMAGGAALEELAVADDLRALATSSLDENGFLARHGFHGPNAGDITAQSWRENPEPLRRLVVALKDTVPRTSAGGPADRRAVADRVIAALPTHQRLGARVALRLAPAAACSLEQSKTAFMMSIDGARAAIRALGRDLVDQGRLDRPDDAYHLFLEELLDLPPGDLRSILDSRREARERHLSVELVDTTWVGNPHVEPVTSPSRSPVTEVTGHGASVGVVEGPVRVVRDAGAETEVSPGDILVCPVTDPSWVSLMTLADALVIDIGSTASHGAIVARELGIPCVIGTNTGTRDLCDGDWVRVDGGAGSVTVLSREEQDT